MDPLDEDVSELRSLIVVVVVVQVMHIALGAERSTCPCSEYGCVCPSVGAL